MSEEVHNARLVSVTPDAEKNIVYMARVSNPSNQANMDTAPRLDQVSDQAQALVSIRDGIHAGGDQHHPRHREPVLRHRSFSYQEFSQRYSAVGDLPDIQLPHLRTQDTKNKQASHDNLDAEVKDRLEREIQLSIVTPTISMSSC